MTKLDAIIPKTAIYKIVEIYQVSLSENDRRNFKNK